MGHERLGHVRAAARDASHRNFHAQVVHGPCLTKKKRTYRSQIETRHNDPFDGGHPESQLPNLERRRRLARSKEDGAADGGVSTKQAGRTAQRAAAEG